MDRAHHLARLLLVILVGLCSLSVLTSPVVARAPAAADLAPSDAGAALLPQEAERILERTAERISTYHLTGRMRTAGPLPATIDGSLDLTFVNSTGIPQRVIYFRLYPNNEDYAEGAITLGDVTTGGQPLPVTLETLETTAAVTLPRLLQPGEHIELSLTFLTTIPSDPTGGYGMFQYDSATDTYSLAQWFPLLAGWDPERGWNLDPLSVNGDPTFTDAAFFDVGLTAPSNFVFATSGSEVARESDGVESTYRFVTGPSRDFVMAASPNFLIDSVEVDGTIVRSFHFQDSAEASQQVLADSAEALRIFNELFGVYPYREFDIVQIDLQNRAAGVEFAGIVFIADNLYWVDDPSLEYTVVHEVAHQWWYGLVGNNQYQTAFLDEGLTNYSTIIYWERKYGPEMAERMMVNMLKRPYFQVLFGERGDQIAHQPTDDFVTESTYGGIIYGKAPLGFHAIRNAIGDEAFFGALQAYTDQFSFAVATPADLLRFLEDGTDEDVAELWRHWFEAAEGHWDFGPEDLQEVLG